MHDPYGGVVLVKSSFSKGRIAGKVSAISLIVAGWVVAGCGTGLVGHASSPGSALVLADSVTNMHFNLSVVDGSPTLTGIGNSGTLATGPQLIDGATGEHFALVVTSGALTLVPNTSGAASAQIGLADTVTAKTYELAVVSGGLTLTAD